MTILWEFEKKPHIRLTLMGRQSWATPNIEAGKSPGEE